MKKLLIATALITGLTAGGDIAPTEPILEVHVQEETTGNFYVGLGAVYIYKNETTDKSRAFGGTGLLGYQINEYVGFEYRGTLSDGSFGKNGIYAKFSVPVYRTSTPVYLYALGGYSRTHFKDTNSRDAGEIGLGLEVKSVARDVDVFIDGLYSLRTDRIIPLVGVRYNF